MTDILEEKVHVWEGLKEYKLSPEEEEEGELLEDEYSLKTRAKILRRLEVNKYFEYSKINRSDKDLYIRATINFHKIIEKLNEAGFDIGKGDTKYGYKMPLPKKGELNRKLIIFRRY